MGIVLSSAKRFEIGPTSLTSFGMMAESPALSSVDGALVDKGTAVPKLCLSPVEMRTLTAVGDLLSAGKTFAPTRTIFHQPPLWFCPTEETIYRTISTPYVCRIHPNGCKFDLNSNKFKSDTKNLVRIKINRMKG